MSSTHSPTESELPACGMYRTRAAVGEVPAGRLVYFHNHGDPGPGIYLPESWRGNRAKFAERGVTLPEPSAAGSLLEPLPEQGFYRVLEPFHCCEKRCRLFEVDSLVQLGFNAHAQAILFVPELVQDLLAVPETGTPVDSARLSKLKPVRVATASAPSPAAPQGSPGLTH